MTNAEKFKETFGYEPRRDVCVAPFFVCDDFRQCAKCPFWDWWRKEYKPCFRMKERTENE